MESEFGRSNLIFPGEIIWLGGAPGAGKGTNTPFVMEARGITANPIVISDLLSSPRALKIKAAGNLVGDEEVVELLLRKLLDLQPEHQMSNHYFTLLTKHQALTLKLLVLLMGKTFF